MVSPIDIRETEMAERCNSALTDTRELKIDELNTVSGGSWLSVGKDFSAGLTLGFLGVSVVTSVVHIAAKAAKSEQQVNH